LGPEGGDCGGEVIVKGTPEKVSQSPCSYTGKFMKKLLNNHTNGNRVQTGSYSHDTAI